MTLPTIAIIGAGPAGCAAAFHLARAGLHPTIIEARPFPRVKVCGEFVSPAATALLEAILPPAQLLSAGARRVDRFVLELAARRRTLRMPTPAWALSRRSLDALLLAAARDAGARVLQPAPVVSVEHTNDGATIRLADDSTVPAQIVLHADGHGRFCGGPPTPQADGLIGHKCHFTPREPIEGVRIRAAAGAYVGTIQIEPHDRHAMDHGEATIALVARRALLARHRGDIDTMVQSLWPEFDPRTRTTDWLSCGVARSGYQPATHPRAFRLGNAAGAVDPIGGEGIGLALWSGTTLANLLTESLGETPDSPSDDLEHLNTVQRRFAALYRKRLRLRRPSCQVAAACLISPRLIGALWPALGLTPLTLAPWYAATGKSWFPQPGTPAVPRPVPRPDVAR